MSLRSRLDFLLKHAYRQSVDIGVRKRSLSTLKSTKTNHWWVETIPPSVNCLLVDGSDYLLLGAAAIPIGGHSEDLGGLMVIRALQDGQEPEPHGDEANLPAWGEDGVFSERTEVKL